MLNDTIHKAGAERYDVMVVGGGMVGSAIAYGLARAGARVALLDEGDLALRAARGNFGLVWTQSKGEGMPAYVRLTRDSAQLWHAFAEEMSGLAGRDIGYRQAGGLDFCLDAVDFAERGARVARLHNQSGLEAPNTVMLDRGQLQALMPGTRLGEAVVGASLCHDDGHVNPLYLLRALHAGLRGAGGAHLPGPPITAIEAQGGGFIAARADGRVAADRVVVAAGVHTTKLAAMVGIDLPVRPVRGQNIVTERLPRMLPLPASALRQTEEGVVQIGVTYEDGMGEPETTVPALARMAARAVRVLPALARARMVRAWGALRPMTPDGFPAYAASLTHPGAFACACHSGVTLSAAHVHRIAPAILAGDLAAFAAFDPARFRGMDHVHPAH
jgi:glycine/D-amino acid oxidase-like deaminating enzyme